MCKIVFLLEQEKNFSKVKEKLNDRGHEVLEVESQKEALGILKKIRFGIFCLNPYLVKGEKLLKPLGQRENVEVVLTKKSNFIVNKQLPDGCLSSKPIWENGGNLFKKLYYVINRRGW